MPEAQLHHLGLDLIETKEESPVQLKMDIPD
jgi:hypothetical protein